MDREEKIVVMFVGFGGEGGGEGGREAIFGSVGLG